MPQVYGWSDDDFEDRAHTLAALIRRVWRAIARQIAANAEKQNVITLAVGRAVVPQWQQAVDDQIVGFVRDVYLDAAGGVSDALDAPDELLVGDDLVEVYTNAARNRLVGIGDDVWNNVQAQITLGNQSGESIPQIAERIRNVAGVSEARSLTIARTEVHAAFESGSYEQALFVDPDAEKVWLATEDERTRPSHRAADGQRVKIGKPFNVGGSKLRFPGDPLGAAEDCINCRCSVAYDFDMITTVVEEPEPAMVAAGEQAWKPHLHPRGNDGKFIKSGIVADFLKKSKPNIIDVTKAVGNLDSQQWGKLTDAQKTHIKSSVDKLPKGTATHNQAQSTIDSLEKSAAAVTNDPASINYKPKTKIGATYAKLKDAKHGDVLATGTKYNSAGVAQKFKITADKSHVHPDYMPHGKMKLEFLKKNGEPSGQATTGDILSISQKLHPLPAKGKKPGKVEWDEPGVAEADAPQKLETINSEPVALPGITPPATPAKIPAGLKGKPGDPAKITTGVVWGKHPAGTTIVESEDGQDRIVWNGKKYEFQTQDDLGDWATQFEMSKKDFYAQHKEDTAWKIPGGAKQHQPLDFNTPEMDAAFGDPNAPDEVATPNEAAEYEPTPDEIDWHVDQWKRDKAAEASEPPQTPPTPPVSTTSAPDWTKSQDFSGFTKVGGQAGSNPGGKYKSPDGSEWYVKKPKSAKHAANEQAAAAFYNLAGIHAPQVMKGDGAPELGGDLQTGTKIVPGAKPNLGSKLNDPAYVKEIQSGFAMDAWLANWDVAGMGYDNIVEGADGKPHRIDVGGALLYRAQGEPKSGKFGDTVEELETLRNPGVNPQSAKIFGSMTDEDIRKSAAKVEAISEAQIDQIVKDAGLPASVAETLKARRNDLLTKFPPISEVDELLNEVVGPPVPQVTPMYDIDAALGDLENGVMLSVDETLGVLPALTKDEFDKLPQSAHEQIENALEYALSNDLPGVDAANTAWLSLKNAPSVEAAKAKLKKQYDKGLLTWAEYVDLTGEPPEEAGADESPMPETLPTPAFSSPMIDGSTLGLKPLKNLVDAGTYDLKYTDGQVIATSPDGMKQVVWRSHLGGYALKSTDTGAESSMHSIKTMQTIRTGGYHVPENLLEANHGGTLVENAPSVAQPLSGPMISGASLGLKPSYDLIVNAKKSGKYTDGQVIAVSPDGTKQIVYSGTQFGYVMKFDNGVESFMTDISTIKKIRDDDYHVPESLLPNHGGTLVENTSSPSPSAIDEPDTSKTATTTYGALYYLDEGEQTKMISSDGKHVIAVVNSPMGKYSVETKNADGTSTFAYLDDANDIDYTISNAAPLWYPAKGHTDPIDTETLGVPNGAALASLENGDVDELTTLDEKYVIKKTPWGDSYSVTEFHPGGTASTILFDHPDELESYAGLHVWYSKKEIEQSKNAPDATANVSATPVDLDTVNEKIDLGEYTSGEVIGVSADGQFRLVYSSFLNGLQYQHKVGNTGDDDLDWDTLGTFDDNGDGAVAQFKDAYPSDTFFEPNAQPQPDDSDVNSGSATNWDNILTDGHVFNDVVAQTGDGKYQLVHKGMGTYHLYKKAPGDTIYTSVGQYNTGDLHNGDLDHNVILTESRWQKVAPGQAFKSGKTPPAKKMPAKKVAKAGIPATYSPAVVTPGEKKFYLEDAEYGNLVAAEAVHLLNGADGLTLDEANNLTPKQTANINKALEKALDKNTAGAQAAWDKWADLENQLNVGTGHDSSQIADLNYLIDMEDAMWAGDKSFGDILAVTSDGKHRIVVHSTEGPGMNPDSFAVEMDGPLGWEIVDIYTGNVPVKLWDVWHDKSWLIPDSDDDGSGAPADVLDNASVTFDPPGNGTAMPGTIFGMLSWVPEGKTLLVGKDNDGNKYKMTAAKDSNGNKVINVDYWSDSGTWGPGGQFGNEAEYTSYYPDDGTDIKWDPVGSLPDKSALDDFMGNPNAPTPGIKAGQPLGTTDENAQALWNVAKNSPDGAVIATATTKHGKSIQMVVETTPNGQKVIKVQKKNENTGKYGPWYSVNSSDEVKDDLMEEPWHASVDVPGAIGVNESNDTPSAPVTTGPTTNINSMTGAAPGQPVGSSYWAKLNSIKDNVPGGTIVAVHETDGSTLVKTYDGKWAVEDADGAQIGISFVYPQDAYDVLPGTWQTPSTAYSAPTAPTAPTAPSGPPAPKLLPINKVASLKNYLKANGNLGYYSKPENIWKAIKEWQAQPGNEQHSPMDMFKSLDHTLKTSKPNPYQEKMTKWASTKKGAEIIGQGGIYGSTATPATPSATSSPSVAPKKANVPDIEAGSDISGFDEAKKKLVYDTFKGQPSTYLSSPEYSVFDAMQAVAQMQGLTFGQVVNVVDEYGAQKFNKPNESLFKKKLTAWLATPEAAAHILNEPEVVKGLVKPPAFLPQYDPYLNPGQIPSFEESSKLTYDYVPSSAAATKIWADITAKTSDYSASEKKALKVWTGGAYTTINEHLFTPSASPLGPTHHSAMIGSQKGMRPSDRPMILVRGTGFAGLGNAKNHAQLEKLVGTTWRNNAFAASSVGSAPHDQPGVHSPAFSHFPLWVEVEAPPGTPMAWVTPFSSVGQGEREMLLAANLHYQILSVEKKNIPGYGIKSVARVRVVPKPEGAAE